MSKVSKSLVKKPFLRQAAPNPIAQGRTMKKGSTMSPNSFERAISRKTMAKRGDMVGRKFGVPSGAKMRRDRLRKG